MTSATLTPFKTKKPRKQTISTVTGWKEAMKDFPEHYVDAEFMGRLEKGIKLKAIKVEFPGLGPDYWDGEMRVKFAIVPDAMQVVNGFVRLARADEALMEDAQTLFLWWD